MTETIHLAHCIHGLGLGGAQQIVKTLVRRLRPERHRSFVYCCLDGPVRTEVERAGGTVRIFRRRFPKLDPGWAFKLARAMRQDDIDIVHTHLFGDSLHGRLAARAAGDLPVVMTLHSATEILKPVQRLGYRWLLASSIRAVACSQAVRSSFLAAALVAENRLTTIRNGIEDPLAGLPKGPRSAGLRQRLGLDPEAVVLATVGRLSPEKDLSSLLSAYGSAARSVPGASQLAIIGDGPLRRELELTARANALEDSVRFLGFLPDVPSILPAVDVVVFNSISEGLPVALLEAMAMARCIIGTDVPGIVEAVRPEREGLIVPSSHPDRLREALVRVIERPALRNRLGQAARLRFNAAFRADRMTREYETLYHEIARERRQRRRS